LKRDPFRCLDDPDPGPGREGFEIDPPGAAPIIYRDPTLMPEAPYRSILRLNGEYLVRFRRYRPGPLRRFLTWAVLGWRWEDFE